MKIERFGTTFSAQELAALRRWLWFSICSTLLLLCSIGYYQANILLQLYHAYARTDVQGPNSIQDVLQQKSKLKKDLQELKAKEQHITRVRQQLYNPYRIIQELYACADQALDIQSITCVYKKIELTLVAQDRKTIAKCMHHIEHVLGMYSMYMSSLQTVEKGVLSTIIGRY